MVAYEVCEDTMTMYYFSKDFCCNDFLFSCCVYSFPRLFVADMRFSGQKILLNWPRLQILSIFIRD